MVLEVVGNNPLRRASDSSISKQQKTKMKPSEMYDVSD